MRRTFVRCGIRSQYSFPEPRYINAEPCYRIIRRCSHSLFQLQDAFLKIVRHEGFTSLWSGLSPTLILALPATVVYFVTYEQLRSRLKNFHHNRNSVYAKNVDDFFYQPAWVPLVAGCTARTWSVMAVSPLELMRIKMQSERMNYFREFFRFLIFISLR